MQRRHSRRGRGSAARRGRGGAGAHVEAVEVGESRGHVAGDAELRAKRELHVARLEVAPEVPPAAELEDDSDLPPTLVLLLRPRELLRDSHHLDDVRVLQPVQHLCSPRATAPRQRTGREPSHSRHVCGVTVPLDAPPADGLRTKVSRLISRSSCWIGLFLAPKPPCRVFTTTSSPRNLAFSTTPKLPSSIICAHSLRVRHARSRPQVVLRGWRSLNGSKSSSGLLFTVHFAIYGQERHVLGAACHLALG